MNEGTSFSVNKPSMVFSVQSPDKAAFNFNFKSDGMGIVRMYDRLSCDMGGNIAVLKMALTQFVCR
jgi:hypothetical protein